VTELFAAILFLFLYYIRPQDWIPSMAGFNMMRPMMVLWLIAMHSNRRRTEPRRVLVTPHDWLMLIYFGYVVWTAPDAKDAFMGFFPLVVFYAFTVQSLENWEDLLVYLKGWNAMLLGIAVIALASLYGFDFTGAVDMTAANKGRLCIGTWLHDNPNALGHSVILALPLSYLLYFWRGGLTGRFVIFPAQAAIAVFCTYKTESKGAFLVGGALFVLIFVFGRPLVVRLFILALAATVGISALSMLPRMSEMGNLRADEGVQGRLMAWEAARTSVKTHAAGVGWKQFRTTITWNGVTEEAKTHCAYVQVTADLGIFGLAIFLGGMWVALRSTVTAYRFTKETDSHERCRRVVMLIVSAYAISAWMINRQYHTEYFLMIALAGAIHRLVLRAQSEEIAKTESTGIADQEQPEEPVTTRAAQMVQEQTVTQLQQSGEEQSNPLQYQGQLWTQLGLLDVAACAGLAWGVLFVWDYILANL
jgi:uncharacterized membrane protein YidH (DUF202 family)